MILIAAAHDTGFHATKSICCTSHTPHLVTMDYRVLLFGLWRERTQYVACCPTGISRIFLSLRHSARKIAKGNHGAACALISSELMRYENNVITMSMRPMHREPQAQSSAHLPSLSSILLILQPPLENRSPEF